MKIISWNVNGIRAAEKKGFADSLAKLSPDIICLQETKAQDDQVKEALKHADGYHIYCNSAEKKGYSGTAILSREEPVDVSYDINIDKHDKEGRVITAEYDSFYLVTVYVPNSGQELARLEYRKEWDNDFCRFLKKLETKKPVIACGDFNVAHQPIDLARPKANYNKSAGYTQPEIDGISNFMNSGFTDTFRHFYPDKTGYSWWSYRFNARARNIGWRIDYFLAGSGIMHKIKDAFIFPEYSESDHCPVGIEITD